MLRGIGGCLSLTLAGLALLPGCAQLPQIVSDPLFGRRARDLAKSEQHGFSTAYVTEEPQAPKSGGVYASVGDANPSAEPKKLDSNLLPVSAVPLPEPSASPVVAQPALFPKPLEPKQDKSDYAPAIKAIQCMLDEKHQEAIQHLRAYDDSTQEFLLRLLPPLTLFLKRPISEMSPQEIAVLIDQIDGLRWNVRARSELVIGKMCCCKQILGYGWYESLPENHAFLSANRERPGEWVQLYVELKNFASEQTKHGDFETRLSSAIELTNAKGEVVWSRKFDKNETTLRRRARINDLYSTYRFYVPELPAGKYQLTIQIADETTGADRPRIARKTMDFQVSPIVNQANLR